MRLFIISCLLFASALAQTAYTLVSNNKECGDSTFIILSETESDAQACADLADANPLCDEYFEISADGGATCRCNPQGHICDLDGDTTTTLYKRVTEECGGNIALKEECTYCKCGGVDRLTVATYGHKVDEYTCAADAFEAGAKYISYKKEDGICVYGGSLSSPRNCEYYIERDTYREWSVYSLSCSDYTCDHELTSVQVCEECKCYGASKFSAEKYKTQEECQYHAFQSGYKYYSWRDNRNLCVFGGRYSSNEACEDSREQAHSEWGIYQVTCEE